MKALLHVLRVSRVARRDAVLARLASAQAALAAARSEQQHALAQAQRVQAARHAPNQSTALAAGPGWRLALQASCDALVERWLLQAQAAETAARTHEGAVQQQRAALNDCERALMRNDEWAAHQARQDRVKERLDEQNQDDDLAAQQHPRGLAALAERGPGP